MKYIFDKIISINYLFVVFWRRLIWTLFKGLLFSTNDVHKKEMVRLIFCQNNFHDIFLGGVCLRVAKFIPRY